MQTLASDVGGLKRALTNVKSAGGMGEVQLEALLSDVLSPNQYEKNAHPNPANSRGVVEFAVKLPSKDNSRDFIYLPIDLLGYEHKIIEIIVMPLRRLLS